MNPIYMKWYTKQLQALKKAEEKIDTSKGKPALPRKKATGQGHYAGPAAKTTHHNPVGQRNRNRPKTDLP